MSDIIGRAEAITKKEVQPSERPPPRMPYDGPSTGAKGGDVSTRTDTSSTRTDVRVVTDSRDRAHVNVDTHEGGTSGAGKWPRDPEEWKRLLAKAAPWLAAAALVAAGVRAYKQKDGEDLGNKARRTANRAGRAVDDAADSAKHGWFGLKSRTNEAVDSAGDKAHDAKHAAGKKAEEAKGAASRAAQAAKDTARHAASDVKHAAHDTVDSVKHGVSNAAHSVADGARRAEHAAENVFSKGAAKAGVAEEKTGRALQDAGKRVENVGHDTRRKYGDAPVEAPRKKFLGIF